MTEPVVKCRICGKECTGGTALAHTEETGHNSWDLILPEGGKDKDVEVDR